MLASGEAEISGLQRRLPGGMKPHRTMHRRGCTARFATIEAASAALSVVALRQMLAAETTRLWLGWWEIVKARPFVSTIPFTRKRA